MPDTGQKEDESGAVGEQREYEAAVDAQPAMDEAEAVAGSKRTASERQEAEAAVDVAMVPHDDEQEEDPEGVATKRQRTSRKGKSIPPPKKLNNEQWEEMFQRLVKYKEAKGDCLVPKRYTEDPKLGTWVETQRVQYKKLQKSSGDSTDTGAVTPSKRLNAARLEKLQSIGFAWSAKNLRKPKQTTSSAKKKTSSSSTDAASRAAARQRLNDLQWNDMYVRLAKYKEENGDCLVPKKYDQDPKLATWVETQRVLYNRDCKNSPDNRTSTEVAALPVGAGVEGKSPEEWAEELEKGSGSIEAATEDDAADVVAATMEAATMEVVDQVTAATEAALAAQQDAKPAAVETPGETDAVSETAGGVAESSKESEAASEAVGAESELSGNTTPGKPGKRLTDERKALLDSLGFVWSLRSKRVDENWDKMFERLVQYKDTHGDCLVPSRYEEDVKLGKWVETQRYEYTKLQRASEKGGEKDDATPKSPRPTNPRLTEERLRRLESIGFEWKVKHKMKRFYDKQWESMYQRLLEFKKQHGHCVVPKRYPEDMKLGTWVHTQRIQYRKFLAGSKKDNGSEPADGGADDTKGDEETSFRLTEARRKRLEEAGFVWSARETEKSNEPSRITRNSYDHQWDVMFDRLVKYKEANGDCLVPKRCREDPKLGTWVDTQRVQYKKMKKQLAKMGIDYKGPAPEAEKTDEAKEGDTPPNTVPKPVVGRLTDDRIRRLEGLGFVWSLRDDWQKHYNELVEFKEANGHCNVAARYPANRRLGIWVSAQRQQYKIMNAADETKKKRSAPLTEERIRLLNELGFTWTIRSRDSLGESWNQRLAELRAYKEQHGNTLVPSRYPANPELGVWVGTQRTQYRLFMKAKERTPSLTHSSSMSQDRIRQLEELGFVWMLRGNSDNVWRKRVSELIEYRTAHGNLLVPARYAGNPRLGAWVDLQRVQYKLMQEGKPSSLDAQKVVELDSLGFIWEAPPQQLVAQIAMTGVEGATATASALAAAATVKADAIDLTAASESVDAAHVQEDAQENMDVGIQI